MNRHAKPPTVGHRFQKGVSGNPGGRPKAAENVRDLARAHTVPAVNALVRILRTGKSESAIATAAEAILNRGWGKPLQQLEVKRTPFDEMTSDELRALDAALQDLEREEAGIAGADSGQAVAGKAVGLLTLQ